MAPGAKGRNGGRMVGLLKPIMKESLNNVSKSEWEKDKILFGFRSRGNSHSRR